MLNFSTTEKSINEQLSKLSNQLNSLKLNIEFDEKTLSIFNKISNNVEKITQSLTNQKTAIQNVTKETNKETESINKQISAAEKLNLLKQKLVKTGSGDIKQEIVTTGDKFSQNTEYRNFLKDGSVQVDKIEQVFNKQKLDEANKNLEQFVNNAVSRITKVADAFGGSSKEIQKVINDLDKLSVQSSKNDFSQINNQLKSLETQANIQKGYIQDVDRAHALAFKEKMSREEHLGEVSKRIQDKVVAQYLAERENRAINAKLAREAEALDRAHFQALKTEQDRKIAQEKLHYLALQQNQKREEDFLHKKIALETKIADIRRRFGSDKNVSLALDGLNKQLGDVTSVGNYSKALKNVDLELKKVAASANTARSNNLSFAESFKTAMVKFPIWMAASTAFFGSIRGLRSAIDTIVEVDTQMTVLKRVMDKETNFDKMLKGSIEIANELGRSITQVNEAMTGFARQGYSEDQVLSLTKVATLMTNISELSGEEAMSSLTAAMTIFNIEASESIRIIDALNEVDDISLPTQQCVA
jgi:predicted DNA-binding ArsR family transcriptional regulator